MFVWFVSERRILGDRDRFGVVVGGVEGGRGDVRQMAVLDQRDLLESGRVEDVGRNRRQRRVDQLELVEHDRRLQERRQVREDAWRKRKDKCHNKIIKSL